MSAFVFSAAVVSAGFSGISALSACSALSESSAPAVVRAGSGCISASPVVMRSRKLSSSFSPIPGTFISWSTLVKSPCSSRYCIIAAAFFSPIPFREHSCEAVAVLTFISFAAELAVVSDIRAEFCAAACELPMSEIVIVVTAFSVVKWNTTVAAMAAISPKRITLNTISEKVSFFIAAPFPGIHRTWF